jgi:hypothetical protein
MAVLTLYEEVSVLPNKHLGIPFFSLAVKWDTARRAVGYLSTGS